MNAYAELFTIGLKVFSEERSRQLSREHRRLLDNIDYEEGLQHPDYNSKRVKKAKMTLENFVKAYNLEFKEALNAYIKTSSNSSI